MRKAIGFSFLDDEKAIPRALDPWYKQGYTIIAVDGRYKTPLPPHLQGIMLPPYSTDNSEDVLKKRYGDKLVYEQYTGTQIQKRQRYMDIAGELDCEILIVFDSDEYIHPEHQDWQWFNKQLEDLLISPSPISYMWVWIPSEELWPKQYNAVDSDKWHKYMRIHTKPGEQQYAVNHWSFMSKATARTVPIDEIELYASTHGVILDAPYFLKPGRTLDGIRFATDRIYRSPEQLVFGDGWAFQEHHEDDCRLYNAWRKTQKTMEPLDLTKPHYYNEKGQLVWLEESQIVV
jgi:hypothetical protein